MSIWSYIDLKPVAFRETFRKGSKNVLFGNNKSKSFAWMSSGGVSDKLQSKHNEDRPRNRRFDEDNSIEWRKAEAEGKF